MFNDPEGTRINFHEAHISKPPVEAKRFDLRMYLKGCVCVGGTTYTGCGLADSQTSFVARCFNYLYNNWRFWRNDTAISILPVFPGMVHGCTWYGTLRDAFFSAQAAMLFGKRATMKIMFPSTSQ